MKSSGVSREPWRSESLEYVGSVVALEPNRMYRVRLARGSVISAHVGTDLRMVIVRLIPGDKVVVKLSDVDPSRGRIIRRLPADTEQER